MCQRHWVQSQMVLGSMLALSSQAMILLTGDNSANQTAPDSARADVFNAVAQVVNGTGSGGYGSAVRLRGKYLLTANHVNVSNGSHVTFDGGATLYARDTAFSPVQIGTADLKLIKLVEDPGLNEVKLFDAAQGDVPLTAPPTFTTATIVGVGVGRDPNDNDGNTIWGWGGNSTMAKRWGENRIEGSVLVTGTYDYEALNTTLEANSGDNEAAVTRYDSGCGLFIEHNNEWKLAGIAVQVSNLSGANTSTFSNISGDLNQYVRINQLAAEIEAAIPNLTTYSGWKVDHSLYGADADDSADTDGDGISQIIEYALGGDPHVVDLAVLPTHQITEDSGDGYLELVVTRPIGLQGLSYIPQTSNDLANWPTDATGILDPSPTPVDNGDGTETLVYRRASAISAHQRGFIRLKVQAN